MTQSNKSENEGQRDGGWPKITENEWYTLAITTATLTFIAILAAFIWIFYDGFDGESDLVKAQALSPFGVALFAIVTFCTAGWRGSINTRQADQTESEGRAKLLQEGAKLLGENNKASHVSAGIATLGVLVSGHDKNYAYHAMNLLADYVEDHMRESHGNRHRPQISGIMRDGDLNGVNTGREIWFSYESPEEYDEDQMHWHFIPGFQLIRYFGGAFDNDPHYELQKLRNVEFNNVDIKIGLI